MYYENILEAAGERRLCVSIAYQDQSVLVFS